MTERAFPISRRAWTSLDLNVRMWLISWLIGRCIGLWPWSHPGRIEGVRPLVAASQAAGRDLAKTP